MSTTIAPVAYSHHLVALVARAEAAATRIAGADPDRRAELAAASRRESAALSTRLDGSPLLPETVAAIEENGAAVLTSPPKQPTAAEGWARALSLNAMETQEVAGVEYARVGRALDAVPDAARSLYDDPVETIRTLHGLLVESLVDPGLIGSLRRTHQALHDGAQGMVLYNPPAPAEVPELIEGLARWLTTRAVMVPPVIVAGVVHEQILEIQPFEAANGRLARVAARAALHAGGIDPHGVAVLERALWRDPSGYISEVAATVRRGGDLTRWLERHTSAVAAALEDAVETLLPSPTPTLPERGRARIARMSPGAEIGLRQYAVDVGVDLRRARRDLEIFARAGVLDDAPGGNGLRFLRRERDPA